MPTSSEEQSVTQAPVEGERPVRPLLLRVVGMLSLVVCALAVYFAVVAEYLHESAVAAADHALVRALVVLAGACAISGFAVGMYVLTRQDEAILQERKTARVHNDRTA